MSTRDIAAEEYVMSLQGASVDAAGITAFNAVWAAAIDVLRSGLADAEDDVGSADGQGQAKTQGTVTGFQIAIVALEPRTQPSAPDKWAHAPSNAAETEPSGSPVSVGYCGSA